jgi:hypothetical protein
MASIDARQRRRAAVVALRHAKQFGDCMRNSLDENAKRRLTGRGEIATAVDFLVSRGIAADDIPVQLARYYYVDIDLVNEILLEDRQLTAPLPSAEEAWRSVA